MTTALLVLGLLCSVAGVVGCILPALPGPPLSFAALLILAYARDWAPFGVGFLVGMGLLTAMATVSDYLFPALGARHYGASRKALQISMVGMFVGIFVFPPWGMILGAFAGAVLGEWIEGKRGGDLLRAGWGVFLGNMAGMGVKLLVCGFLLVVYVYHLF